MIEILEQCVTVSYGKVKGKAREYQYWQPAVYEVKPLKDGTLVWRYKYHTGTARRSEKLATQDALNLAKEKGIEYRKGIRHLNRVIKENNL